MLVAFEADARPTLLTMARLERELSEFLHHKVDLRTANEISHYFRNEVLSTVSALISPLSPSAEIYALWLNRKIAILTAKAQLAFCRVQGGGNRSGGPATLQGG